MGQLCIGDDTMKTWIVFSLLLVAVSSRHRFVRQAEDEAANDADQVTKDAASDAGEDTAEVTTVEPAPEPEPDAPVTAIKEANLEKCQKCLKPTYKYKHESFCNKCFVLEVIDSEEADKLNNAIQCKKCLKPKYRSRHDNFCSTECHAEEEEEEDEMTVEEEIEEMKDEAEEDYENTIVEEPVKKPQNKKKDKKKKNKKPWFATTNMEETKAVAEEVEVETPAEIPEQTDAQKLGIFGNILKALVVANTWRT